MKFIDRLEQRAGWLAFPGFLRFYALFHVLVFALQWIRPDISQILAFDRHKILSGEIWRVATMFFAIPHFGGPGAMSLIFLLCGIFFIFMVSDGLENAWGPFKTSLFYYTGIALSLAASFVFPVIDWMSGGALYISAFLAFCTLFPRTQILLMFVLPIEVRFLGFLTAGGLLLTMISAPAVIPFMLAAYANYILWAGIPALRGTARVIESAGRNQRFQARKLPAGEAFHTCIVCNRTDQSDPTLEFRIARNGEEYCADHLPE